MKLKEFREKKPIVYFAIVFTCLSLIILMTPSGFIEFYRDLFIDLGNNYFEANINNDTSLMKNVEIVQSKDKSSELEIRTIFYDRKLEDGNYPLRFIVVDIFNEAYIPVSLLIILVLSTPLNLRRKLISLLIGFVLVNFYVLFKFYAIAFDNYNNPEFALKELSFPVSSLIYFYNYLLNFTGYSLNFMVIVLIWLIVTVRQQDLEKISSYFSERA